MTDPIPPVDSLTNSPINSAPIPDPISDAAAATAFRRLVAHLQHRHDAENIDLMGLAGFCRNCLADWSMEATNDAGGNMTKEEARTAIQGMPTSEWKRNHQTEATPERLQKMKESVAKNASPD